MDFAPDSFDAALTRIADARDRHSFAGMAEHRSDPFPTTIGGWLLEAQAWTAAAMERALRDPVDTGPLAKQAIGLTIEAGACVMEAVRSASPGTEATPDTAGKARTRARADWQAIVANGGYEAVIGSWVHEALCEYINALEAGREPNTTLIVDRSTRALGYLAACVVILEARVPA